MPGFRDILKKKEKIADGDEKVSHSAHSPPLATPDQPEFQFTFLRSDTHTQEIISPPTFSSQEESWEQQPTATDGTGESRISSLFKGRSRTTSTASRASATSNGSDKSNTKSSGHKRLSQRLHLRRNEPSSNNVPQDLPEITSAGPEEEVDVTGIESQWEARATRLAKKNELQRSRPSTPIGSVTDLGSFGEMSMGKEKKGAVSSKQTDDNIQEAIRLHEAGDLETSTRMFGRLADPKGENNALSQVLYGLALR